MEHLSSSCCTIQVENTAKIQHADIRVYPVDKDTIAMLNASNNALIGEFINWCPMGPLYGSKQDMSKMHVIVKTTLLPPILLVVQTIP